MNCSSKEEENYFPVPYELEIPTLFQQKLIAPLIPTNNPLTEEGVSLGKKLFFDTILSGDETQSCSSCHSPSSAFSDESQFSVGIDNKLGKRNAMPIFNLAWNFDERFNWDGSQITLEEQAFEPVRNEIELHGDWMSIERKLQDHPEYPDLFLQAFGTSNIDSTLVTKAIAQFERTLISGNSKFDKHLLNQAELTEAEANGFLIFSEEAKGDCFHCHGSENNPLWTDNQFHNNGLDTEFLDLGLGAITGDPNDNGKFKTPSLRNLKFTAPYMHDGRFATLDEVINHYSEGLQNSATIDPLMKNVAKGGVQLTEKEKADLKAFLLTLSDNDFAQNLTIE
jgi:cytochrome c peroxidase